MWEKIVRYSSLLVFSLLITCCVMHYYEEYLDNNIDALYSTAQDDFGRHYYGASKGEKQINENLKRNDLVIFGSSELSSEVPQNPRSVFPNNFLPYNVDLVGRAYVQSLLHAEKVASLAEQLHGKKFVYIVSLQWFSNPEIDKSGTQANFSELQFYRFMADKKINDELKKYNAKRLASLLKGESTFAESYLYASLYKNDNFISKCLLKVLYPYYYFKEKFLVLKDKQMFYKQLKGYKTNQYTKYEVSNWDIADQEATKMAESRCSNNEFYVDNDYYDKYLKKVIATLKDKSGKVDLLASKEWEDYKLFLEVCRANDLQPYIVFMPTNGRYYDYIGIDSIKRNAFYDKLGEVTREYGFDYLDLRDKEYQPYFMKDVMHLGWRGWLYVDQKITEHYQ